MDAREANVLLTRLRLLDARFPTPASTGEARLAAETWAEVLRDVALGDALRAAVEHYRESPHRIMPVDVLSRCEAVDPEAARARAEWLAARGLTEEQVARMSRAELEALVRADREVTRA